MSSTGAVVIGAGTAGLAVSRHLQLAGIDHVAFERGRIAETWRTQRWDSFQVNTPNHLNALPGAVIAGDPEGFATARDLVGFLEGYADTWALPVHEGVTVTAVTAAGDGFRIETDHPDWREVRAGAVVVASGGQNVARIPRVADELPRHLLQIHAAQYRNPGGLPPGGVLVVGSAQSGCQIAEDLLAGGRQVFLSVSRVARARRRYRGRDTVDWFHESGFFDQRPGDLPDPAMQASPQPQISGVGDRGHTVSLQGLARRGVTLVGRLVGSDGARLRFDDSVGECLRFADEGSEQIKGLIDDYIARRGLAAAAVEPDPEDAPVAEVPVGRDTIMGSELGAVVWSTGFGGDFSWLRLPVVDPSGHPIHRDGLSDVPGLFFVGLPWLRTRRSGIITGVDGDASWIASAVSRHLLG